MISLSAKENETLKEISSLQVPRARYFGLRSNFEVGVCPNPIVLTGFCSQRVPVGPE